MEEEVVEDKKKKEKRYTRLIQIENKAMVLLTAPEHFMPIHTRHVYIFKVEIKNMKPYNS